MKNKYHYLYKITNLINNKFYIGVRTTIIEPIKDHYYGSGKAIKAAIKKYGEINFKKEILEYFDTKEEAYKREAEIVNESLIQNPLCYNINLGGYGGDQIYDKTKLSSNLKNKFYTKNKEGKYILVDKTNNLPGVMKDRITVYNLMDGKRKHIIKEQFKFYYDNGYQLKFRTYDSKNNKYPYVFLNDLRILNRQLKISKGCFNKEKFKLLKENNISIPDLKFFTHTFIKGTNCLEKI